MEQNVEGLAVSPNGQQTDVIRCAGFLVQFSGDRSVGIFDQEWTISGDFEFHSAADFEAFKQKISEAFEYCSDTPIGVESLEERSVRINAEIAAYGGRHSV